MTVSPFAGKPAPAELLIDIPRLVTAYYTGRPDASVATQRVAFGTSGHRGSSFDLGFNEWHVLAISQAICLYREAQGINGPLFVGIDTHALSTPAGASALEVFAANGVTVMIAEGDEYTPTPAVSTPFSATTVAAPRAWRTASSSRRPTTHRKAAATSTTLPTVARPIPTSPNGSKPRPTNCWPTSSPASSASATSKP